ncbi:hypothetical protein [Streptomyces sp. NPDC097981]
MAPEDSLPLAGHGSGDAALRGSVAEEGLRPRFVDALGIALARR